MVRVFARGAMDRSFMVDPLSYFSFQPVLQDWCNKCYPVCGMVHIKEPLLLIGKSSPCGGSGFPLSLSEWSFTICLMPYNRIKNVLNASLNKTFPSVLGTFLYMLIQYPPVIYTTPRIPATSHKRR